MNRFLLLAHHRLTVLYEIREGFIAGYSMERLVYKLMEGGYAGGKMYGYENVSRCFYKYRIRDSHIFILSRGPEFGRD